MAKKFLMLAAGALALGLAIMAPAANAQVVTDVRSSPDGAPGGSGVPNMNLESLLRNAGIGSYVYATAAENGGFSTDQVSDRGFVFANTNPATIEILFNNQLRSAASAYSDVHRIGWYQTNTVNTAPSEASITDVVWEASAAAAGNVGGTARLISNAADFAAYDPTRPFLLRLNSDTPGNGRGGPIYGYDFLNPATYENVLFLRERDLAGNLIADSYIVAWEDLVGTGDRDYNDVAIRVRNVRGVGIPEPGTIALLGLGALATAGLARRRNK